MPMLKSKKRKQNTTATNRTSTTQIQNQSVVLLDLSATRATCYFDIKQEQLDAKKKVKLE
jgi:hypothetical protein